MASDTALLVMSVLFVMSLIVIGVLTWFVVACDCKTSGFAVSPSRPDTVRKLDALQETSQLLYYQMRFGDMALSSTDAAQFNKGVSDLADTLTYPEFYINNGRDIVTNREQLFTVLTREKQATMWQQRFISDIIISEYSDVDSKRTMTLMTQETGFVQGSDSRYFISLASLSVTYVEVSPCVFKTSHVVVTPIRNIQLVTR